jgi:hypothetical protein
MYSQRWLIAIVALFVVLATYYNFVTPPFEAPDEIWHYHFVREVAAERALPVVNPAHPKPSAHEGLQAPLYYILAAPSVAWMDPQATAATPAFNPFVRIGEPALYSNDNRNRLVHSRDVTSPLEGAALALHLARFVSTLLGAGTLLFTYLLAREFFHANEKYKSLPLLAAAFGAFLPQFLFVSSTVSNDSAAILLSAAAVWQLAYLTHHPFTLKRAVGLGVTLGLALLAKLSCLTLIPFAVVVLVYAAWRQRAYRTVLLYSVVVFGLTALLGGWWFARNLNLYGSILPSAVIAEMVGTRPNDLGLVRWLATEAEGVWLSMWGVFGWFNILAPQAYYWFYDLLALGGGIGIVVAWMQARRRAALAAALWMLPLWIFIVALALWYFSAEIISNQGRLMFPALSAYAALWAWGILTLVPARWARWTVRAAALTFGLIAAVVPLWLIAPSYQPTAVASNQLPNLVKAHTARFENGIEWLGARVERDNVRAGDAVAVTFYYRVAATPALNQAVFIHFVNSANVIVAQRDSLIGQGNPDALKPNVLYADTLRVSIPHTVPAPDTWRIEAGMYNSDDGARVPVHSDALFTDNSIFLGRVKAQPALTWDYNFGDQVQLVRGEMPQGQVKAGQTLPLTLYWRAHNTSDSLNVFLHALGEKDHIWASANTPLDPTKPMRLELRFDPRTPPGVYPLEFGVETTVGRNRLEVFNARGIDLNDRLFLGSVRVTKP